MDPDLLTEEELAERAAVMVPSAGGYGLRLPPKPIRAWADRDEWTQYLQWDAHAERFIRVSVPSGGEGALGLNWQGYRSVVQAVAEGAFGPLRSVRVLFAGGAEVESYPDPQSADYWIDRTQPRPNGWLWNWVVRQGGRVVANGEFEPGTDADAVERALAEAQAWFAAYTEPSEYGHQFSVCKQEAPGDD